MKLLTGVSGLSELHTTGASGVQKEPATQSPVIQSETTVDQSESSVDVTAQSSTGCLPPSESTTEGMPLTACRLCSFLY